MDASDCGKYFCYFSLDEKEVRLFGFPEFLAGLALMVLAWTIADFRYRFRVRTSPLVSLPPTTFFAMAACGMLTLLTDLWRAESWSVLEGNLITPLQWQASLGAMFLVVFLMWAWFALIKPARFGRSNAWRYAKQLYLGILRSHPSELPELADELSRSAGEIVRSAFTVNEVRAINQRGARWATKWWHFRTRWARDHRRFAYEIMQMMAERKFCRTVVATSPLTALAFFSECAQAKKFDVPLSTFAKNITTEAIARKDSFAYHEVSGHYTGFFGQQKPLTHALYGNISLMEAMDQVLDVEYDERDRWLSREWEAYFRLFSVTFAAFSKERVNQSPPSFINRAIGLIERCVWDLRWKKDELDTWPESDAVARFRISFDTAMRCLNSLDQNAWTPPSARWVHQEKKTYHDVYSQLAEAIYELVLIASTVGKSWSAAWTVQHNIAWNGLFDDYHDGPSLLAVQRRVLRLMFDQVVEMERLPTPKGAAILGMSLNVLGLEDHSGSSRSVRTYHRFILGWVKRNYVSMAGNHPTIAAACLVEGLEYDAVNARLVKTHAGFMGREPTQTYFALDRCVPDE